MNLSQRELTLLIASCTDSILVLQEAYWYTVERDELIDEYQELRGKLQSMLELQAPTKCED